MSEDEWVEATREGIQVAMHVASRRSTTRTAGSAPPRFCPDPGAGRPHAPGLAVAPAESLPELRRSTPLPGRRRFPPARVREGVHGRDARLADRADAGRLGVDHEPGGASRRSSGRRRQAGRWRYTRSATARTVTRSMCSGDARSLAAARPPPAGRACAVPRSERHPAVRRLGVARSVQFTHATSDRDLAERFWGDRLTGTYAFRSLLRLGRRVVNGSDAPVEELDPLVRIVAAVTRTSDGRAPWLSLLRSTDDRAGADLVDRQSCLAGRRRAPPRPLASGYLADLLVVLSREPFTCPPDELESVEIVSTMVGGRWVFQPPPWD